MYEKLPNFCFLCGILGHEEVNCPKIYVDNFIEPDGELSYGNWMRVNGVEIGLQVALKPVDCSWAQIFLLLLRMRHVIQAGKKTLILILVTTLSEEAGGVMLWHPDNCLRSIYYFNYGSGNP